MPAYGTVAMEIASVRVTLQSKVDLRLIIKRQI
jgi:hypothetical protein